MTIKPLPGLTCMCEHRYAEAVHSHPVQLATLQFEHIPVFILEPLFQLLFPQLDGRKIHEALLDPHIPFPFGALSHSPFGSKSSPIATHIPTTFGSAVLPSEPTTDHYKMSSQSNYSSLGKSLIRLVAT